MRNGFIGIYDFSYMPFALGDVLTFQMDLLVRAKEAGIDNAIQFIVADPRHAGNRYQPFVNRNNYQEHLSNIYPAFLCNPLLSEIRLIGNKDEFDNHILWSVFKKNAALPSFKDHLLRNLRVVYPYKNINKFYFKNKYIPYLSSPQGYEKETELFFNKYCRHRFPVSINIRQSKLYGDANHRSEADNRRDSPSHEWYVFFNNIHKKYPDVVFIILGGYTTWEREIYSYPNVIIPRTLGYGLGHELTILKKSNLFMGTSSGFSAMATFSDTPYIITNVDPYSPKYFGITFGARQYPFALKNQILSWEIETSDTLNSLFEPIYNAINSKTIC